MARDIKISIKNLYKIFGPTPDVGLEYVRRGMNKADLLEKQNHVLGLRDINVDMRDGEITVIMGLSGSGKSTLIRHLNRLIEPTAGEIRNLTIGELRIRIMEEPLGLNFTIGAENEYETDIDPGDKKNDLKYFMTVGLGF